MQSKQTNQPDGLMFILYIQYFLSIQNLHPPILFFILSSIF